MNEGPKRRYIIAGAIAIILLGVLAVLAIPAHAGPWDGTLQPFTIRVPRFDSGGCGACTDTTTDSTGHETCQMDTSMVTVIAEADKGLPGQRFYRQWAFVARESTLAVNDWRLPVGFWRVRTLALESGQESCWSAPFGRVSRQNPAAVPAIRLREDER